MVFKAQSKGYWGHANILITNISNGSYEDVKKHTCLIEGKLFQSVPNILSGKINKSNMQNTRNALYIRCAARGVFKEGKFVLYPSLWSILIGHWLFYRMILSLNWILTSRNWIRNTHYANHAKTLLIIIWRHKPWISKHSYWTVTFNSPSLLQQRCVYL